MKSAAGFIIEVLGAVLIVSAIAAAGPALGSVIGADKSVNSVLEFMFLGLAGIVALAFGLFMHRIEKLSAGD
jgi:hypothetical protein